MTIKAIETRYAGCHFRSRLEARWAVFFDAMQIQWEYEPERFALPQTFEESERCLPVRTYLPDFYLPENETWVEVKGSGRALDWRHILPFCDYDCALPGLKDSRDTHRGLMLLGPIPRVNPGDSNAWSHPILQHHKGLTINHASFFQPKGISVGQDYRSARCHCGWGDYLGDGTSGGPAWLDPDEVLGGHVENLGKGRVTIARCREIQRGYVAARSARFEHGQSGTR